MSFSACAAGSYEDGSRYDDTIDGYDIESVVNKDNTLNTMGRLRVYFNRDKHGIFRKIPLNNNVVRLEIHDIPAPDYYNKIGIRIWDSRDFTGDTIP